MVWDRGQYTGLIEDAEALESPSAHSRRAVPRAAADAFGTRLRRVAAVTVCLAAVAAVLLLVRPRGNETAGRAGANVGAAVNFAISSFVQTAPSAASAASAASADAFLAKALAQAKELAAASSEEGTATTASPTAGRAAGSAASAQQVVQRTQVQAGQSAKTAQAAAGASAAQATAEMLAEEKREAAYKASAIASAASQAAQAASTTAAKQAAQAAAMAAATAAATAAAIAPEAPQWAADNVQQPELGGALPPPPPHFELPPMPPVATAPPTTVPLATPFELPTVAPFAMAQPTPPPFQFATVPPVSTAPPTPPPFQFATVPPMATALPELPEALPWPEMPAVATFPPLEFTTSEIHAGTLAPLESRNDGNVCDFSEEFFGGLCYKKCELLTSGERPHRKGPWTCCNNAPCDSLTDIVSAGLRNPFEEGKECLHHCDGSFGSAVLCSGYDVSGDGSCPHTAGACLTDEELFVGVCYKKCSLLTGGVYSYRSGALSCCKADSELGCMKLGAAITSPDFEVGGGDGKGTPATFHMPIASLTEDADAVVSTTAADGQQPVPVNPVAEKPDELLNDGNTCDDSEELFEGLCYRKCGLLTNGKSPIRNSAWTCCENEPCNVMNSHKAAGMFSIPCHGYGISGDGSCPHKAGACYKDEELYLGICYKSCFMLTNGDYPHRSSPSTCCKTTGLGCLMPGNVEMKKEFDVGGGNNDGDASTPKWAHPPLEQLTEGSASAASTSKDPAAFGCDSGSGWSDWQVTENGNVNVRRSKFPTALVIDVKQAGSVVKGCPEGNWLKLEDEGGFMMMSFGENKLATKVPSTA